jgi:hypothetical protein
MQGLVSGGLLGLHSTDHLDWVRTATERQMQGVAACALDAARWVTVGSIANGVIEGCKSQSRVEQARWVTVGSICLPINDARAGLGWLVSGGREQARLASWPLIGGNQSRFRNPDRVCNPDRV